MSDTTGVRHLEPWCFAGATTFNDAPGRAYRFTMRYQLVTVARGSKTTPRRPSIFGVWDKTALAYVETSNNSRLMINLCQRLNREALKSSEAAV